MHAEEPRGQHGLAALATPSHRKETMHHALLGGGDRVPLPGPGPVHQNRHSVTIVRCYGLGPDQRRVHQDRAPGAVEIREPKPMRRRHPVNFLDRPRPGRIALMRQDRHDPRALGGDIREPVGQGNFRDTVTIEIAGRGVDRILNSGDQDVLLPAGILEPAKFRQVGGHRDQVRPAVAVQIGGDDLIAAEETGIDRVRDELDGRSLVARQPGHGRAGRPFVPAIEDGQARAGRFAAEKDPVAQSGILDAIDRGRLPAHERRDLRVGQRAWRQRLKRSQRVERRHRAIGAPGREVERHRRPGCEVPKWRPGGKLLRDGRGVLGAPTEAAAHHLSITVALVIGIPGTKVADPDPRAGRGPDLGMAGGDQHRHVAAAGEAEDVDPVVVDGVVGPDPGHGIHHVLLGNG